MPRYQKSVKMRGTQGLDKSILLLLFLGLSLICLPGWAQEEEEEEFKGVGINFRLRGGAVLFGGGDLDKGTAGMFDRIIRDITAYGFVLGENERKPFSSGYELGGDLVYYFSPRIGVGVGGSLVRGHKETSVLFHAQGSPYDYRVTSNPELKVLSLRLGLFLALPLNHLLTVCASAGPAWHFAEFKHTENVPLPGSEEARHLEGKAGHWGVHGGLGLEIRMNRRLAFILEAQARYARISGFEGKERSTVWEGGLSKEFGEDGTLYFLEGEDYPRLHIIQGQPDAALQAREAVFDFSGLSLTAGLNFKF